MSSQNDLFVRLSRLYVKSACHRGSVVTFLRCADVVNVIVDDELEVRLQQGVQQRRVGNTLPVWKSNDSDLNV